MSKTFRNFLLLSAITTLPPILYIVQGRAIAIQSYALFVFVILPLIGLVGVFASPKWKGKTFTWKLTWFLEPLAAFWMPWAVTLITAICIQNN